MRLLNLPRWLRMLAPAPSPLPRRELLLGAFGMSLGLALTWVLTHAALGMGSFALVAPIGASALLLFFVPASPLAQPWSVVGGNLVAAAVGLGLRHALGDSPDVGALAAALAAAAMYLARCLHPPGAAVALGMVTAGHPLAGPLGELMPVAANSGFIVLLAIAYNNAVGRRYPHHGPTPAARAHGTRDPLPTHRAGLEREDVDAALASFGEPLDIDRDDLEDLLHRAELNAQRRHWHPIRCGDIMSRDVVSAGPDERLDTVWDRLTRHELGALPVLDRDGRLAGLVTLHDFFIGPQGPVVRGYNPARRVQEIMRQRVRTAHAEQAIADLVPAFSDEGLHHVPVLDAQRRVVGIITQSDLVAALFKAGPTMQRAG